jgi:hypothetical protein
MRIQKALLLFLLLLVTALFLPSPGTFDVTKSWLPWAANADRLGLVKGFAANDAEYPPLTPAILLAAVRAFRSMGASPFQAIKLSIMLFLLATSLVFWLWTKDFWSAALLHVSLLLNSVALGYLDVYFAPSLLLSLWALRAGRLVWFTVFFAIATMTKWQPLIVAPFLAVYVLDIKPRPQWKLVNWGRALREIVMPALVIGLAVLLVYRWPPIWRSLRTALTHKYLSGDALNFNWVLMYLLHVFAPERYGKLYDGRPDIIMVKYFRETVFSRALFLVTYVTALVALCRQEKTFENLMRFSLIGYLAYFICNIGVHENHLFLAVIVSVVLVWLKRSYLSLAATIIVMANVNLVVFYGIQGGGIHRMVAENVDMALLLSVYNTVFFAILWARNVFVRERPS